MGRDPLHHGLLLLILFVFLRCASLVSFVKGNFNNAGVEEVRGALLQRNALKRLTKKGKIIRTVGFLRNHGIGKLKNKVIQKQLNKARKIAEEDSWVNEFLSFSRPQAVGGELVMPPEVAQAALEEIYGSGPDLQNIDLDEFDDEVPTQKEIKDFERLRLIP